MVWRRRSKSINPHICGALFTLVFGIGAALLFIAAVNARLRPILLELALAKTSNCITAAIDRAVAEQAISYADLVTFERTSGGDIVAMTSNMSQANLLRSELLETALKALDGLKAEEIGIPLGTIFDIDLFSGLGPEIDVRILYTGTASAKFENKFFSAGVNQTCHQILFNVSADIVVLLPGQQYRTNVTTDVCIAETIIVGKVPETYLQIQ